MRLKKLLMRLKKASFKNRIVESNFGNIQDLKIVGQTKYMKSSFSKKSKSEEVICNSVLVTKEC